jgi:hypothetical protein
MYNGVVVRSHNEMSTTERPTHAQILKYARNAVTEEAAKPSGWSYDRQSVEHEILNHFGALTNSDEDYEFIVDAIREAENEYNQANDCEL